MADLRPHGNWWGDHATLADLRKADEGLQDIDTKWNPIYYEEQPSVEDQSANIIERVWQGDRRLPAFGKHRVMIYKNNYSSTYVLM